MENKSKHILVLLAAGVAIIIATVGLAYKYKGDGAGNNNAKQPETAVKYADFAKCLKDKGAVFYGAFWCGHCQNQKKAFGASVDFLPYVECSTPDGKGQLAVCADKKIEGYPAWVFSDGSRQSGEAPFEQLASKTGCALPQ